MSDVLCGFGEYSSFVELVCRREPFEVLGVVVFLGAVWPRHDAKTGDTF
jgi:hypothetical protein